MLTWKQAVVYFVIVQYCVFGLHFINLEIFHYWLSLLNQAVVVTMLILAVYPVLAWRRKSAWVRIGSFWNWLVIGLGGGVLTVLGGASAAFVARQLAS